MTKPFIYVDAGNPEFDAVQVIPLSVERMHTGPPPVPANRNPGYASRLLTSVSARLALICVQVAPLSLDLKIPVPHVAAKR
jgi:hypothetical protein